MDPYMDQPLLAPISPPTVPADRGSGIRRLGRLRRGLLEEGEAKRIGVAPLRMLVRSLALVDRAKGIVPHVRVRLLRFGLDPAEQAREAIPGPVGWVLLEQDHPAVDWYRFPAHLRPGA